MLLQEHEYTPIINAAIQEGAFKAAVILVKDIPFDCTFRKACQANTCGNYGQCWMCPPYVGDMDQLIAAAKKFRYALVYQTITEIEDSFDIEGMLSAGKHHNAVACKIKDRIADSFCGNTLQLGAGGCRICEVCAKREEKPCRHPEQALASLEAYGVAVSELADLCGLRYSNGKNTVTYFGTYFFDQLKLNSNNNPSKTI